ncbi:hypothetical protein LZ30DRAFT_393998 [Colletotrichum cereale]|nr:hypothetical protein LZ30DRAFT_393998 [Colletotrichum cereale]
MPRNYTSTACIPSETRATSGLTWRPRHWLTRPHCLYLVGFLPSLCDTSDRMVGRGGRFRTDSTRCTMPVQSPQFSSVHGIPNIDTHTHTHTHAFLDGTEKKGARNRDEVIPGQSNAETCPPFCRQPALLPRPLAHLPLRTSLLDISRSGERTTRCWEAEGPDRCLLHLGYIP